MLITIQLQFQNAIPKRNMPCKICKNTFPATTCSACGMSYVSHKVLMTVPTYLTSSQYSTSYNLYIPDRTSFLLSSSNPKK